MKRRGLRKTGSPLGFKSNQQKGSSAYGNSALLPENDGEGKLSADERLRRALDGLDPDFETRMVEVLTSAIVTTSMVEDGHGAQILVLRLAETSSALTTILASLMSLSPAAASNDQAIKQTSRRFRHALHRKVGVARHDFLRRTFHGQKGGRA